MMKKMIIIVFTFLLFTGCKSDSQNNPIYFDYSECEKIMESLEKNLWCYSCDFVDKEQNDIQDMHISSEGSYLCCDGIPITGIDAIPVNLKKEHSYKRNLNTKQLMDCVQTYYAYLNDIPIKQLEMETLEVIRCKVNYIARIGQKRSYLVPVFIIDLKRDGEITELMMDMNSGVSYVAN